MRKISGLNALKVTKLKTPGFYCDGAGLWLRVTPTISKNWVYRYQIAGRARYMGLGALASVSLADARNRARQARQAILDGKDPLALKGETRSTMIAAIARAMTFGQCADAYLEQHADGSKNDKHRKQWISSLETAKGAFGAVDVQAIDVAMVMRLLEPIWAATPESGSRLRSRIERVLDWASARGYRAGDNPARWSGHLQHLLRARPKAEHHAAMPFAALPAFMAGLRDNRSISARALEFTILTAARTGEAIGALWSELDLEAGIWTVPALRMKASRPHRVPLSGRVLELLAALPRDGSGFVFPGAKGGKPISNMAMLELLKGAAGNGYTVHGFRSAFTDWARERTAYPRDVVEMALAHSIKDKTEAAYRRGDALPKRTRLMDEFARYCSSSPAVDNVVAIRAKP